MKTELGRRRGAGNRDGEEATGVDDQTNPPGRDVVVGGDDHPDPSIFTVLTSPSDTAGTANMDFVIFPPRWMVAEETFRPPWFHRNVMSEFMGLVHGTYDGKARGFVPGGASLHNCMAAHGPDADTFKAASNAELAPQKIRDTLAFMFETKLAIRPTEFALTCPQLQTDYDDCWSGLDINFNAPQK